MIRKNELAARNHSLLKASIKKINKLLHKDSIDEFLDATRTRSTLNATTYKEFKYFLSLLDDNPFFLLHTINRCSPRLSYVNDFTWFSHGTMSEHLDYGLGKVDETIFEKYLPYQVGRIQETKQTFFIHCTYEDDLTLVDAILLLIKEEKYTPANIILVTLIEGITRKFALQVYKKQNPNISDSDADNYIYHSHGNLSIEKLIRNRIWKKDIPIPLVSLLVEYSHVNRPTILESEKKFDEHQKAADKIEKLILDLKLSVDNNQQSPTLTDRELREILSTYLEKIEAEQRNLIKENEEIVLIGLDVYLDFLAKQFKDERNCIIHGKYSFFKNKWKTLVYLTALEKLIEKILWYESDVP